MIRTIEHESASVTLYEDEYSRRIRVDDYTGDLDSVLRLIENALPPWAEKLIVKVRPVEVEIFKRGGYSEEAMIAGYFSGTDMYFLTRYPEPSRGESSNIRVEEQIIRTLFATPPTAEIVPTVAIEYAKDADAIELASLYRRSFQVYPTPVNDPNHVLKTMKDGTVYVVVRDNSKIISAASAEINETYRNAELTDCVTAEGYEGKGLMRALLLELERHLRASKVHCLYSIARSESYGMNKAFYQLGYTYGGRMTKNCMIYSGLEDMNVWYKFENSAI